MRILTSTTSVLALLGASLVAGSAVAAPGGIPGRPGGGGGPGEVTPPHNLSYPVILPEGLTPDGFPADGAWRFADIIDPSTACFTGNTGGEPVPTEDVCYYDGSQVWWLSKRTANFWKAFSLAVDPTQHDGPVEVTAVDVGDLLESSPDLNLRRIRTEVTLYQNAALDDYFAAFIPDSYPVDFTGVTLDPPVPPAAPCELPDAAGESVGCFAAFEMSGAVPGTEESINELQGTNFGLDAKEGLAHTTATGELIDPTQVRFDADSGTGFHATVYSRCARLIIQKLTSGAPPVWDPQLGYWTSGANAPVVDIAAYNNEYSSEVNSSGTLIYGYNWDASRLNEGSGTYRLTYVLDGQPRCALNAEFTDATLLANAGDIRPATLVPADTLNTGIVGDPVYGGLVYVDVPISAKGGGGGGGRGIGGGVGGGNPNG